MRIVNNVLAYDSWRNLNNSNSLIGGNLRKLSSGYRINTAADDPAGLSISQKMRSQISGLDGAISNSGMAISMIQTAEGAFTEIHNTLTKMRELAIKSANSGANDQTMLNANQDMIKSSLETISRIAETTQYGTKFLLNGDNGNNITAINSYGGLGTSGFNITNSTLKSGVHTLTLSNFQNAGATFGAGNQANAGFLNTVTANSVRGLEAGSHRITVSEATYNSGTTGKVEIGAGGLTILSGDTVAFFGISVTFSGATQTFSQGQEEALIEYLVTNISASDDLSAVNNADGTYTVTLASASLVGATAGADNATFAGGLDATRLGQIGASNPTEVTLGRDATIVLNDGVVRTLSNASYANTATITLTDGQGGQIGINFASTTSQAQIQSVAYTINVTAAQATASLDGNTTTTTVYADRTTRLASGNPDGGEMDFTLNNLAATLSGTSSSIVFTVEDNALVFQVGANKGQQVKIGINSMGAEDLAKNVRNTAGFRSLADIDVSTAEGASEAIALIDAAIDEVSAVRSKLGAFQTNTLEANLRNLQISRQNMQASESSIRDTDMAAEMADFIKNQILVQSGTAMLAQANRLPQNVLQLLGG